MNFFVPLILHSICWIPCRFLFYVLFRFRIVGGENLKNLDRSKGVLIVSNHVRIADPFIVLATLPFFSRLLPLYTLSLERKEYKHFSFYWVYGGLIARLMGSYPVKRGMQNYELSLAKYVELLGQKRTVLIFPEGGMTKTGQMGDPKPGATFLSKRTEALVVPMCIYGAYKTSFSDIIFGRKKVIISVGKPFRYQGDDANEMFESVKQLGGHEI